MGQNKLVPVVRPDINGKLVTRHVVADRSASDPERSIPSPVATPQVLGGKEYARRIAESLTTDNADQHFRIMVCNVFQENLGVESLKETYERMDSFTEYERLTLREHATSLFNYLIQDYADKESTEKVYHGVLESVDVVVSFLTNQSTGTLYRASTRAVRQAGEMGIDPRFPTEYQRRVYRFLLFRQLINDQMPMDPMEVNEKSEWFEEVQDRLAPHADRITSNERVDWEWMKELINPENAASLSEGTL